ncbi:glycine cleavage system protein GcvH [uncultured Roseibium sp.]|uniref:glycine cleavage system protein GcvH n=1 Tax=uncultured Roseibium sp. TaxID=1936171 RepID=UPI00261EB4E1|nr:glycine cleavage system protein GcvH [uncultured Roseibium sp.]
MTIYYSKDHEWISVEGDIATVGITTYAQEQLGDVVYVELPEAGREMSQGDEAAVVESVKAASEVYAPIDGEVVEANAVLADEPAKVNEDPEGGAWFLKMKVGDPGQLSDLMDQAAYKAYVETL